ncbi:MAG: peptidylprolyl isomerase [Psychroflexus sp.]|nr:peptidylprolyl isomerase [Psychroflexus sp.]
MKSILSALIFLISITYISAQENKDSILFSINGEDKFTVNDFLEVYNSKIDDNKNIKKQVDLFINYQLKVKEAKATNLDTLTDFKKEYAKYRNQLADNFIVDGDVTDELIKETHHRLKTEVRVSHILIKVPDTASAEQKKELLKKAKSIQGKAKRGADFEALALKYSEDPSVKKNKGDMGWFKAFNMVYPFESAAYKLDKGEISKPVKSQFGHHIIKKTGERKSQGKVSVAHILITPKPKDSKGISAKEQINKLYNRLKKGENFADLAKEYSDSKRSAVKGGKIKPFPIANINSKKFEKVAFDLKKGELSKPFRTRFGWHIVKKIDNFPVPPLDEMKSQLIKRIKTSKRVKLLNDKIQENMLKYHEMTLDSTIIEKLSSELDSTIYRYKWEPSKALISNQNTFLSIDDTPYSVSHFSKYLQKQQRSLSKSGQKENMVAEALDKYVYAQLMKKHKEDLDDISPEFKRLIKKYKEGLMVFELMERNVWNKAKEDTAALKNYYKNNAEKYKSKPTISGLLAEAKEADQLKKLKKKLSETDSVELIKKAFPDLKILKLNDHPVTDSKLPDNLKWKKRGIKVYRKAQPVKLVKIDNFNGVKQLEFKEATGKVIADYQNVLEKKYISYLRDKYDVEVFRDSLKKLKKQL